MYLTVTRMSVLVACDWMLPPFLLPLQNSSEIFNKDGHKVRNHFDNPSVGRVACYKIISSHYMTDYRMTLLPYIFFRFFWIHVNCIRWCNSISSDTDIKTRFQTLLHHTNINLTEVPNRKKKKSNGLSYTVQLAQPSWPLHFAQPSWSTKFVNHMR